MMPSPGGPPFDKIAELEESCLRVALLHSALELGLFDAIAGGAALRPGGLLTLRHLMPDEEHRVRTTPAMLAVQLLLLHPGSCVYTASEYSAMLKVAGFRDLHTDGEELVWAIR
jgi:hypothetical protein